MSDMQTEDAQNYTMTVDSDFQELIRDATMVALVNDLMEGEYTTLLTKSLTPRRQHDQFFSGAVGRGSGTGSVLS